MHSNAQEAVDYIDASREAVDKVVVGCTGVPDVEELAKRVSAGTHVINFWVRFWCLDG